MLVQTHYRTAHRWLDDGSLQLMQMFVMSQLLQDLQNPLQYRIRFQSSVPSLCGGVRVQSLPYKEGVEL